MRQIHTEEELRAILAPPRPTTRRKILDHLDEQGLAFLRQAPYLLIATADPDGGIEVSPKGDEPGFVRIEDPHTILIPDRAGNNLAFGLSNILRNPQVGVIVLRPGTGETLRLSGRAEIFVDPEPAAQFAVRGQAPKLGIRVHIRHAYFHCARSTLRAGLWQPERWPEAQKISFGRIIAKASGGEVAAEVVDDLVEAAYRAVSQP